MLVVAHVLVAVARCDAGLAHDDDAGRATVDAQTTTGTYVFVDHENHVIVGVGAGGDHVRRILDGAGRQHVNALPRADVDAAFAHDALGLIDVKELLRFDALVEIVDGDFRERVATGEVRKRGVGFGLCHDVRPSSPSGRP